jgi:hypothetical protein
MDRREDYNRGEKVKDLFDCDAPARMTRGATAISKQVLQKIIINITGQGSFHSNTATVKARGTFYANT